MFTYKCKTVGLNCKMVKIQKGWANKSVVIHNCILNKHILQYEYFFPYCAIVL